MLDKLKGLSTHHLATICQNKKGVIMDQILHRATMAHNIHLIPLENYDPVHPYEKTLDKMKQRKDFDMNVIKLFYVKVGHLFRHVSVFSLLDHMWFDRFSKTGVVSETDKVMMKVIFQCYLQIDRGVRFKSEDPLDANAKLTNREKQSTANENHR